MKIADSQAVIIGDGAIGVAIGAMLTAAGLAVGFVGRRGPVAVQARLQPAPGDAKGTDFFPGVSSVQDLVTPAPDLNSMTIGLVVVTVKAFDLARALEWTQQIAPRSAGMPSCAVWSLSNGAVQPIVAAAAARRPDLLWRLGYCTFGVSVDAPRVYSWRARSGELALGPLPDPATAARSASAAPAVTILEQHILKTAPLCRWHTHIDWWHRRKWLTNTVLNTLAAVRRSPRNGDVLRDLPMVAAVFAEAYQLGLSLWGAWPFARQELYSGVLQVAEATADNENSMVRDLRLGRPTESAFLAGLADDAGKYPLLSRLHREIEAVQSGA